MIYKNWFLCLIGLIALAAAGSSIFLYLKMNELSDKLDLNEIPKEESVSVSVPDSADQSSDRAVDIYGEIKKLEYQLMAAEEELDMASNQLNEVIENQSAATPEETQKALIKRKTRLEIEKDYELMRKRLDFSPEETDEFKRIELEWRLAELENWLTEKSAPEEMERAEKLGQENMEKYSRELTDLMGEDKYRIYDSYKKSTGERWELDTFMGNTPPENRISYDVAGDLIFNMIEVRTANEREMGLEATRNSSDSDEDKFIREYEVALRSYKKYEDVVRNILSPEQAELFNAQLGEHRKQFEGQYNTMVLMRKERKENENADAEGHP